MNVLHEFMSGLTFGIELEGAWDRLCDDCNDNDENCCYQHDDGSVRFRDYHSFVGEIVSPNDPFLSHGEVRPWLLNHFPDSTNSTCGLHFHVGNIPLPYYSHALSPKFFEKYLILLETWGRRNGVRKTSFYERLNGNNGYCRREYVGEMQVAARSKGTSVRYSAINYCYGLRRTMEVRVLPMFGTAARTHFVLSAAIEILCTMLLRCGAKVNSKSYTIASDVAILPEHILSHSDETIVI